MTSLCVEEEEQTRTDKGNGLIEATGEEEIFEIHIHMPRQIFGA